MRISQIFQPLITIPKNAKLKNTEITCKSQKLLVECGLVRPTSSGLFTILPLARRALDKLEKIITNCIESTGAHRVSFPSLTAASLWERTGRLQGGGPELIKLEDRHGKKYLMAPTHEEAVADLLADVGPLSYKQLPLLIYQISTKYRDEHRPKHGLLRSRAFSMMDLYGAHTDETCARASYTAVSEAYREVFRQLQLPIHRVEAPSGEMGGSLSHEWQLCASSGEDTLSVCPSCSHATLHNDEKEGSNICEKCKGNLEKINSIEVGHTFILGTKYSTALGAMLVPPSGTPKPIIMSCYGIGITRLLAASLECLSTEKALRWPRLIAPYGAVVIGPKEGSKEWSAHGWEDIQMVHERLSSSPGLRGDVLIDDRHHMTIGKRLLMADRMGYPFIIVCGKSTLENPPRYEVHRSGDEAPPQLVTIEELAALMSETRETRYDVIRNIV